jgi:hypothetical protein
MSAPTPMVAPHPTVSPPMNAGRALPTINTTTSMPTTVGGSSPPRQAGATMMVAPQVIPVGPAAPMLPRTLPTGAGGQILPNVLPTSGNQGMTPLNALPVPPSGPPGLNFPLGVSPPGGMLSSPTMVQSGVSVSDFNALAQQVKATQDALSSSVSALNAAIGNLSNQIASFNGQLGQAVSLAGAAGDAANQLAAQTNNAISSLSQQVDSQNQALLALARGATETFTPRKIIVPKPTAATQMTPSTVDSSTPSTQMQGFRGFGRRR